MSGIQADLCGLYSRPYPYSRSSLGSASLESEPLCAAYQGREEVDELLLLGKLLLRRVRNALLGLGLGLGIGLGIGLGLGLGLGIGLGSGLGFERQLAPWGDPRARGFGRGPVSSPAARGRD